MSMKSSIGPLRIRHFRALWMASVFSNIGTFLHAVAASWAMYELTKSPLWVGLMAAGFAIAIRLGSPLMFFLMLLAGGPAIGAVVFARRLIAKLHRRRLNRGKALRRKFLAERKHAELPPHTDPED